MSDQHGTRFDSLVIFDRWRQFDQLHIEFDPRLTVLTGANASGKTTLLAILAKHFDWTRMYSYAPTRGKGRWRWSIFLRRRRAEPPSGAHPFGRLKYSNGTDTELTAPGGSQEAHAQYSVAMPQQQNVTGVFLTSHRAVAGAYSQVATIPALFGDADTLFEQFTNEVRTRWLGSWTGRTPQQALKESLIAAAVFGEGSASVERNHEAWEIWNGFQQILRSLLPPTLGYRRLRVRTPEIVVETETGDFIFDEASGGMSSIIEMAWQIFLRSRRHQFFTVLIDEPENHLHPALQRELIPSLLRAFPSVQFIVATHSPFVVTASPSSAVYVLEYDDDDPRERRVVGRRLDYANKAASADDTLRRVLGLHSTMPMWAEDRFKTLLDEFLTGQLSSERLAALRSALRENGLESEFPLAMLKATEHGSEGSQQRPPSE